MQFYVTGVVHVLFSALSIGPPTQCELRHDPVIGDNVANINTAGFKSARPTFAVQSHPQGTLSGGPRWVGGDLDNTLQFTQAYQATESALDPRSPARASSRSKTPSRSSPDRTFYLQNDGFIKNSLGMRLQGFNIYDNELSTTLTDLRPPRHPSSRKSASFPRPSCRPLRGGR